MAAWAVLIFVAFFIGWSALVAWVNYRLIGNMAYRNPANASFMVVLLILAGLFISIGLLLVTNVSGAMELAVVLTISLLSSVGATLWCDSLARLVNRVLPFN